MRLRDCVAACPPEGPALALPAQAPIWVGSDMSGERCRLSAGLHGPATLSLSLRPHVSSGCKSLCVLVSCVTWDPDQVKGTPLLGWAGLGWACRLTWSLPLLLARDRHPLAILTPN